MTKPPFGKVKRTITIDPILWQTFTKICFNHDMKYSTKIAKLIEEYVYTESSKIDT